MPIRVFSSPSLLSLVASRGTRSLPALLCLTALALYFFGTNVALAQNSRVAELRAIATLREAQQAEDPTALIQQANDYLEKFPQGRYGDEAQLSLAQALLKAGREEEALTEYELLGERYPESPFREQALSESIPLLLRLQGSEAAIKSADNLLRDNPNSVHKDQVLLWQAGLLFEAQRFPETLEKIKSIGELESLPPQERARAYRMQTLGLLRTAQPAWTPLKKYLASNDSQDQKASILMDVAEVARKSGRHKEAQGYYQTVVKDYPAPAYLAPALYWQAESYYQLEVHGADKEAQASLAPKAIALFNNYLESGDTAFKGSALARRASLRAGAGETQEAVKDFEEASAADNTIARDTDILLKRARLYTQLEQPAAAAALLKTARTDPTLSGADKATLQLEEAQLNYEAENCPQVENLLSPMPLFDTPQGRSRALFMRGFCRYREGKFEKASFDLEGVLQHPEFAPAAIDPLLAAYEQSGQDTRLVYLVEDLIRTKQRKPDADLLQRTAIAYKRVGEPALMVAFFEGVLKTHPEALSTSKLHLELGGAYDTLGRDELAASYYGKALDIIQSQDPLPPEYIETVAHLHARYLALGRLDELAQLHASATAALAGTETEARLEPLRRDALLAQVRAALAKPDGESLEQAANLLAKAAEMTTEEDAPGQASLGALQVALNLRQGQPGPALETYRQRRAQLAKSAQPDTGTQADSTPSAPPPPTPQGFTAEILHAVTPHADELDKGPARDAMIRLYRDHMDGLKGEDSARERNQLARRLDGLYREDGNHAGRASLAAVLRKGEGLDEPTRAELRLYHGRIYLDWGRSLLQANKTEEAAFQLIRAEPLLETADWRTRYTTTALLSQALLARKDYGAVVLRNEAILPLVEDDALKVEVRRFLGQVYVDWAQEADQAKNFKSARIRYHRALDYLPPEAVNARLGAAGALFQAFTAADKAKAGLDLLEKTVRETPSGSARMQYALYLGKVYTEQFQDRKGAAPWLKEADDGSTNAVALEAAYIRVGHLIEAKQEKTAQAVLEHLVNRDLSKSKWRVPIHYRLALAYHRAKKMDSALKHYRIVGGERDPELSRIYPRSIKQSRAQAKNISAYLNSVKKGQNIAIPTVQNN